MENERSKNEHSSGSLLLKTLEVESQRHTMAALIADSRSALVAYLKCHYFLSRCSCRLRNLEGLRL